MWQIQLTGGVFVVTFLVSFLLFFIMFAVFVIAMVCSYFKNSKLGAGDSTSSSFELAFKLQRHYFDSRFGRLHRAILLILFVCVMGSWLAAFLTGGISM